MHIYVYVCVSAYIYMCDTRQFSSWNGSVETMFTYLAVVIFKVLPL